MRSLLDNFDDLSAWLQDRGQPPMRARQVRRWVLQGRAESFAQMSDLPKGLRENLAGEFGVFSTSVARSLLASDGTNKLLLQLSDGQLVECVLLHEDGRHTD